MERATAAQDEEILNHGAIGFHRLGAHNGRMGPKVIESQFGAVLSAFRQKSSPEKRVP
jgi:hypothetical protein